MGRAVRLADGSGNDKVLLRLQGVVTIVDAGRGDVQIKRDLGLTDLKPLLISAVYAPRSPGVVSRHEVPGPNVRWPEIPGPEIPGLGAAGPVAAGSEGRDRRCPDCGWLSPGTARFCARCGHRLPDEPRSG